MNSNVMKKNIVSYSDILKEEIVKEVDFHKEDVINVVMASYSINLVAAVTDRHSRTNPGLSRYVDTLRGELRESDFIKFEDGKFKCKVPDEETLDFSSGSMRVIQTMLEGTVGRYVEVDAKQYEKMYGNLPRNLEVYDATARKKDMIYVIRYSGDVRKRELKAFGKRELVMYPFSNSPPIDIFQEASDYMSANLDDWIDNAKERATIRFKNKVGR